MDIEWARAIAYFYVLGGLVWALYFLVVIPEHLKYRSQTYGAPFVVFTLFFIGVIWPISMVIMAYQNSRRRP